MPEPEEDGLWPENLPAVEAFLTVSNQFRAAPGGMDGPIWLGLDYAAAEAGLRLAGVEMDPVLWQQVQLIEAGAVAALKED